jgi:hypothetical protein
MLPLPISRRAHRLKYGDDCILIPQCGSFLSGLFSVCALPNRVASVYVGKAPKPEVLLPSLVYTPFGEIFHTLLGNVWRVWVEKQEDDPTFNPPSVLHC